MEIKRYNIRVYGILINAENKVLISKEARFGKFFTKFPGGGHELGESVTDCLHREFMEELGVSIEIKSHFYTTDFLQISGFDKEAQLISIYYFISLKGENLIRNGMNAIDVEEGDVNRFFWQPISEITENTFTFPIDKLVGEMLKNT